MMDVGRKKLIRKGFKFYSDSIISKFDSKCKFLIPGKVNQKNATAIPTLSQIENDVVEQILSRFFKQLQEDCKSTATFAKELNSVCDRIEARMKEWERKRENAYLTYSNAKQQYLVYFEKSFQI